MFSHIITPSGYARTHSVINLLLDLWPEFICKLIVNFLPCEHTHTLWKLYKCWEQGAEIGLPPFFSKRLRQLLAEIEKSCFSQPPTVLLLAAKLETAASVSEQPRHAYQLGKQSILHLGWVVNGIWPCSWMETKWDEKNPSKHDFEGYIVAIVTSLANYL